MKTIYSACYETNEGPVVLSFSNDVTDTTTTDRKTAYNRAQDVANETRKTVTIWKQYPHGMDKDEANPVEKNAPPRGIVPGQEESTMKDFVTYYVVVEISTATDRNQTHKEGHRTIHYYGKGDHCLYAENTYCGWNDKDLMTPFFIREYGYRRESDAARNWTYRHPENSPYWESFCYIRPVEIHTNGATEYLV